MNSKCAVAYLLSGDVALKLNDVNKASSDYNQAIYLDENCSEAYFKYAQVYKGVDPPTVTGYADAFADQDSGR